MQIVGIGSEIVECVRIGKMIEKHGELFLGRVFTAAEIRGCQRRKNATERFAAQWAAKEAVLKALGIASAKETSWLGIEIQHKTGTPPKVNLSGALKSQAQKLGVADIVITLAHCRAYATACAIAVKA